MALELCAACRSGGRRHSHPCPRCNGNQEEASQVALAWEVKLQSWTRFDTEIEEKIAKAEAAGEASVEYRIHGQTYTIDLAAMEQVNKRTGFRRTIRCVEVLSDCDTEGDGNECSEADDEDEEEEEEESQQEAAPLSAGGASAFTTAQRSDRVQALVAHMLSSEAQVALPADAGPGPEEDGSLLSDSDVKKVFETHVPGVSKFLYREMAGQFALNFMVSAYKSGFKAFEHTPLHKHLLQLFRLIVHRGHASIPGIARHLREVAEAFMDCQAVQARTVERVGLELRGLALDFRGHVLALLGNYKSVAIKMLAMERVAQGKVSDDGNPAHYENRLTADLGDLLGLNKDDIRLAALDEHARSRFQRLTGAELNAAAARCRELFDVDAFLQAFVAEVNSFSAESPASSLPRQFLEWWATVVPTHKHLVFSDTDCKSIDIECPLALAVIEVLFRGSPHAESSDMYHGIQLASLCC
mmetsp:Transcript_61322/g.146023  ORF Transcript_61322/g.146023 Transcript_61322/m.146023 type:complete len:470 (-) Transcript_61322:67-1476(-)